MSAIASTSYQVPLEEIDLTDGSDDSNLGKGDADHAGDQNLTQGGHGPEEPEELVVLHPEHPLVRRLQAALNNQLKKQLERLNLQLDEHHVQEKEDAKRTQETGIEMFRIQQKLANLQIKLKNYDKIEMGDKEQAREQLEVVKSEHSTVSSQHGTAKARFSRLQAVYDNLMQQFVFTQGVSDDMHFNVKTVKNTKGRAGHEKNRAADDKWKQDLYVDRLTKEFDRITEQIAVYEAQTSTKAKDNKVIKQALSEAEMELESLVMVRKHLLHQWDKCLLGMRRRDEAFGAMQDAVNTIEDQMSSLDREIKSYKQSTEEEQERNEALTFQLYWSKRNVATSRKQITQKMKQQDALQIQYSTCNRILSETERTLERLIKETCRQLDIELFEQKRQMEKESDIRLELENKIFSFMQQQLMHNRATKYSRWLSTKTAALKERKIAQLWQKEDEMTAVALETNKFSNQLESLSFIQSALDEEIAKYDKSVISTHTAISSILTLIQQKQTTIGRFNKKISQIVAVTGSEDMSPWQIKVETLNGQIATLTANINRDNQLWMNKQESLIELTQEIEISSKEMFKLQTQYTVMQQKKIRWENMIESVLQELADVEKNTKVLREDLLKLNTLLTKNGHLSETLEHENILIETDFLHRIVEAERDAVDVQMKHEKTLFEKERLLNSLVEAERQIMLWEKKIQLAKETLSAVDSDEVQGEMKMMRAEIHRMEVRINQLRKQQEQLLRDSEATVARRETIIERRETIVNNSRKSTSRSDLSLNLQHLQRKIKESSKYTTECERMIRELLEGKDTLCERLEKQKKQLKELNINIFTLDSDLANMQDTKDRDLVYLVTLQNRTKKLAAVCKDSYKPLSNSESIDAVLQGQMEQVKALCNVLRRVSEDLPQHRWSLRRLVLSLEAGFHKK